MCNGCGARCNGCTCLMPSSCLLQYSYVHASSADQSSSPQSISLQQQGNNRVRETIRQKEYNNKSIRQVKQIIHHMKPVTTQMSEFRRILSLKVADQVKSGHVLPVFQSEEILVIDGDVGRQRRLVPAHSHRHITNT